MNAHNEQSSVVEKVAAEMREFYDAEMAPDDDVLKSWIDRLAAQPSPVVKQNLTTQPAAAQEAVAWPNECSRTVPEALRFLANHERPSGGEDNFNSLHLIQLASEIERMASKPLYAAPVTAAPAVAYLIDGRTEQGLTFDKAAAETMAFANGGTVRALGFVDGTPAAPGIDMGAPGATLTIDGKTFTVDEVRGALLADASPKGGSEARDAARYRWLREFAVNGSIGIPFHGWLNCDEPASEWDSAIDAAMQAGDAEVQP